MAFLVLEIIATTPKSYDKDSKVKHTNATLLRKQKMQKIKNEYFPKLQLEKELHLLLILVMSVTCIICVYILSCVCSLYDKLKAHPKEQKSLPVGGNVAYGAVRKSSSSDS